jgi:hypothetical protein
MKVSSLPLLQLSLYSLVQMIAGPILLSTQMVFLPMSPSPTCAAAIIIANGINDSGAAI